VRSRLRAALVGVGVSVLALAAIPTLTHAAWTDDVWETAVVSAGSWSDSGGGGGGGIDPGTDDTVIFDIDWNVIGPTQVCADVYVTTNSTSPISWVLTVDPSVRPWNGVAPTGIQVINGGSISNPGSAPVTIVGNSNTSGSFDQTSNNSPIVAGQTGLVQICAYSTPPPVPGDPSWYTVTATPPTLNAAGDGVCTTLTIAGQLDPAVDPFFHGWTAVVDLQPLLDELAAQGLTYTYTDFANGGGFIFTVDQLAPPNGTEYRFTSGTAAALQGPDTFQTTTCVYGFA